MGRVKNIALTGLATLVLGVGIGGCEIPPGATYTVDEHGRQHRVYEEEVKEPLFRGIVCRTIIKDANNDIVSMEGNGETTFFQYERMTIGQEWCNLSNDLNINVTVTNENGLEIYNLVDYLSKSNCSATWKEIAPYQLEKGIYTVRWTSKEGGELDKKTFVIRGGQ